MHFEGPNSLEERWLSVFRELGEPEAILACTYTFNAEFVAELLTRFSEAACEGSIGEGRSFTRLPVAVVCDSTRYRGHRIGFNVSSWQNSKRLFHPKLLIALFDREVVWSDGSLNLTPAGWRRNREIAMLHRPGSMALPRQLREMLEELPQVVAARMILEETITARLNDLPGEFVTSLQSPIGLRFLAGAPKSVEEVHLVCPFFEKDESCGVSLDEKWLGQLAQRYPKAHFHVYLPQLEANPLRVQGCRGVFEMAQLQLKHPILFHTVEAAPGPLHGKVACLVHTPGRIQRAYILVGSPNMTNAALLAPSSRGNVETAWILDTRWKKARRFLRTLGSSTCSLADAEFVEPSIVRVNAWMPLRYATYDPLRYTLRVEWKNASDRGHTLLRYAGKPFLLDDGTQAHPFKLKDGISWLVTRKRGGGAVDGCCPIDVPVELLPACSNSARERTPEEWLAMLGAVWAEGVAVGGEKGTGGGGNGQSLDSKFRWSELVRDLASRMRYIQETFYDETLNSVERKRLLELFQHIYDSYDPSACTRASDRVWRGWVRVELWHTAKVLSRLAPSKKERANWRSRSRRLRRAMRMASFDPVVRKQLRILTRTLEEAS